MPKIAVIPGDGIGSDVTREAVKVLRCLEEAGGPSFEIDELDLGAERYLSTGSAITGEEMARLRNDYDAILLGALGDARVPKNEHAREILLGLRFNLDLYINLRPVKLFDVSYSPLKNVTLADVDMVIFRENTEGVYLAMGGHFKQGTLDEVAIEEDINTRKGVERILRAAFEYARAHGRRLTLADKANAMPHAGSLWRRTFAAVGGEFQDVEQEAMYIDALALDMVLRPSRYQVIVASNLFGDILSDLAAALVGGLGMAPSANLHPGRAGLFEPVHGSAPNLVGTGRANPMAAILTTGLMLDQLRLPELAKRVEDAVYNAVSDRRTTPDLGGSLGTEAVGDAICERIRGG